MASLKEVLVYPNPYPSRWANVCRVQGGVDVGALGVEALGAEQGQIQLWDPAPIPGLARTRRFRCTFSGGFEQAPRGPWPQFPCLKVQDWTVSLTRGLGSPCCGQRKGRTLGTAWPTSELLGWVCSARSDVGFSFKGHTLGLGLPCIH